MTAKKNATMWRYNPSVGTYYNHITYGKTNYTHKHACVYVFMCICVELITQTHMC